MVEEISMLSPEVPPNPPAKEGTGQAYSVVWLFAGHLCGGGAEKAEGEQLDFSRDVAANQAVLNAPLHRLPVPSRWTLPYLPDLYLPQAGLSALRDEHRQCS
jgi:hypothetical protein